MRNVRAWEYRSGSLPISSAARKPGGTAPAAAAAYALALAGSCRARLSPSIIGVRVSVVHWPRTASHAGVRSVTTPGGFGAPAGFHHVWSVELPPMRIVGAPLPGAASVRIKLREDRVGPRAAEVARRRPVLHREARERARDPRAGDVAERARGRRWCRRPGRWRPRRPSGPAGRRRGRARPAVVATARYVANGTGGVGTCQLPSIPVATVASVSQGVAAPATRRWTGTCVARRPGAPGPTPRWRGSRPRSGRRSGPARASARRRRRAGPTASPCTCARQRRARPSRGTARTGARAGRARRCTRPAGGSGPGRRARRRAGLSGGLVW